jgi:hypothetical protein
MDTIIRSAIWKDGRSWRQLGLASQLSPIEVSRFARGLKTFNLPAASRLCMALGLELRPKRRASRPKTRRSKTR